MGLDPNKLSYRLGTTCPVANPFFGIDETPVYVKVTIIDLILCNDHPAGLPPASMILTQLPFPNQCRWDAISGPWGFSVAAGLGGFSLVVGSSGPPPGVAFNGGGPPDHMVNGTFCNPPASNPIASGGIGSLSWGPNIFL